MIKRLKNSYNIHLWYEQPNITEEVGTVADMPHCVTYGKLRDGPMGLDIRLTEKSLSFEYDREKIMFLERQSRLLA